MAIQFFIQGQDFLESRIQSRSLRSEAKFLLIAVDDQHVIVILHGLELLTDGRSSHFVQSGRLREALGLDQVAEGLEVLNMHT